jgi:hypothetical protein
MILGEDLTFDKKRRVNCSGMSNNIIDYFSEQLYCRVQHCLIYRMRLLRD